MECYVHILRSPWVQKFNLIFILLWWLWLLLLLYKRLLYVWKNPHKNVFWLDQWIVDVLWGQPIKLIQVASNSELRENQWNDLLSLKLFPLIASGPQKYTHKIGHNYFTFQHPKKLGAFF
jgi:hypothetical protein